MTHGIIIIMSYSEDIVGIAPPHTIKGVSRLSIFGLGTGMYLHPGSRGRGGGVHQPEALTEIDIYIGMISHCLGHSQRHGATI